MALVTAEALPDEAVLRLEQSLTPYAEDRNRDGVTVVEVYNYTWSAHAADLPIILGHKCPALALALDQGFGLWGAGYGS